MAIPFSNTTQRIPPGFANLLEGLAREVLRNQPEDIPTFAAKYFETLLIEREKTGYDPSEWGAKLEDRFYNNYAFNELAPPGDGAKKEKEETAAMPEEEDKKEIVDIQGTLSEEQAAIKIQSIFRGYKSRKDGKSSKEEEEAGKEPEEAAKEAVKEEVSSEPDKKEPQ
ncbi:sperm surface protein Sp17 [Candoia aspera]|uniref:sperm surface protein Sp17 n=1 Tax=Candoia aspera TaxID=51853 RepID=UPI002FD86173